MTEHSDANRMTRRVLYLGVTLCCALTMGLEFAHLLEWPPKATYSAALYAKLQESLYVWFGNLGAVFELGAVLGGIAVAVLVRGHRSLRRPVWTAAGLQLAALVVFLAVVLPVNGRFPIGSRLVVPAGWQQLRDRWEAGHATGFVLFLVALVSWLLAWHATDDGLRQPTRASH